MSTARMRFLKAFGTKRVFLPVIHVKDEDQALRNTGIALTSGADGVFLIGHNMVASGLRLILRLVHDAYCQKWIGVNFLDLRTAEACLNFPEEASGLWVDDAMIDDDLSDPIRHARDFVNLRQMSENNSSGLYFGGVAFKYKKSVRNLARIVKLATEVMDVVTTSGDATGHAPHVEKLKVIRSAIGNHPLANMSGVTVENVHEFLPLVDIFGVATGISKSFHELDPKKTEDLASAIHEYQP